MSHPSRYQHQLRTWGYCGLGFMRSERTCVGVSRWFRAGAHSGGSVYGLWDSNAAEPGRGKVAGPAARRPQGYGSVDEVQCQRNARYCASTVKAWPPQGLMHDDAQSYPVRCKCATGIPPGALVSTAPIPTHAHPPCLQETPRRCLQMPGDIRKDLEILGEAHATPKRPREA